MRLVETILKNILVLAVFFFLSVLPVRAEQINSFDVDITVNRDGTINVTEIILYDFGSLERHGILRTIPYTKTNQQGKQYKLDMQVQGVYDEPGTSYSYTTSRENNQLQIKIGDPNRTVTGVRTYAIHYRVKGALTYFSDHDELYWNVTGNDWNIPITQATANVHLPLPDTATPQGLCYTGLRGSTEQNCTATIQGSTITYTSPLSFNPSEGLTVVATFPKGIVAVLEPELVIPFFQTLLGKLLLAALAVGGIWWYLVYPITIALDWFRKGRDPTVPGPVSAWFEPPHGKHKRSLTPAETGGLVDEMVDLRDILATVIHLAQRGYLKIEERKKNDFYFIRTHKATPKEPLLPFEQTLMAKFFSGGDEMRLKDKKLSTTITTVQNQVYENLISEEFFAGNPQKIRTFFGVMTGLAVFTMNPLLIISALTFGMHMPRKTEEGARQAAIGTSLKNFLSSQERTLEHQAITQTFFEKLLPFAVAFGVERLWAQRFKDLAMEEPDWYHSSTNSHFSSAYLSQSLHSSFSQFQSAATPTSSSSGFSSGGSGGSSGGGGGGGGGGSW